MRFFKIPSTFFWYFVGGKVPEAVAAGHRTTGCQLASTLAVRLSDETCLSSAEQLAVVSSIARESEMESFLLSSQQRTDSVELHTVYYKSKIRLVEKMASTGLATRLSRRRPLVSDGNLLGFVFC